MSEPTPERTGERKGQRKLRRRFFLYWIAATIVIALVVGLVAPVSEYFGEGKAWVAAIVPVGMILLLAAGIAWLVTYVTRRSGGRSAEG